MHQLDGSWAHRRKNARGPSPLNFLVLIVPLVAVGYALYLRGWDVSGEVRDGASGKPVAGVEIGTPAARARSDESGLFRLSSVRPGELLRINADGYAPVELRLGWSTTLETALQPKSARLRVLDEESGRPLSADVSASTGQAIARDNEDFLLQPARSNTVLQVSAGGYQPAEVAYTGQEVLEVALKRMYRGTVRSSGGQPATGAEVVVDGRAIRVDRQGGFELPNRPSNTQAFVLAPGFRRADLDLSRANTLDVILQPMQAKGVYLTFFGAGHPDLRDNVLRLFKTTELNTVVIDVKGDRGWIAYPSKVTMADKIGANDVHSLPDVEELLRGLKAQGVYTIARMVVFKDDLLARHGQRAGVDAAIKDSRTGSAWIDGENLGWVDPFNEDARNYNIALAVEAAHKGFDEIQFDYIRFPTDPSNDNSVSNAVYSKQLNERNRVNALAGFLARAREAVHKAGAYLSIDTFGYSCWADDDMGIGQDLALLSPHVDYISPMVYPSTYNAGLPGALNYPAVVHQPYEVVYQSLLKAQDRVGGSGALLRPWLQYFDDYPWATATPYDAPQIVAQQRAAIDARALGWLFWDPTNTYTRGGFSQKSAAQ